MTPPAFLALWNGVVPGREAEYEAWHSLEHVPERLGAPGFRAARRYRAENGSDYFTLYELDGLEALDTAEYMALVRDPTPWSAKMRRALTAFRRLPCRTLAAERFGQGGAVATLRIAAQDGGALPLLRRLLDQALAEGRILGFMLGEAARIGQSYEAFPHAQLPRSETLLFVEATEMREVQAVIQEFRETLDEYRCEARFWRLLQLLERSELREPHLRRQASREDLRIRWNTPDETIASDAVTRSPSA
jgi:hypothetical protein